MKGKCCLILLQYFFFFLIVKNVRCNGLVCSRVDVSDLLEIVALLKVLLIGDFHYFRHFLGVEADN